MRVLGKLNLKCKVCGSPLDKAWLVQGEVRVNQSVRGGDGLARLRKHRQSDRTADKVRLLFGSDGVRFVTPAGIVLDDEWRGISLGPRHRQWICRSAHPHRNRGKGGNALVDDAVELVERGAKTLAV